MRLAACASFSIATSSEDVPIAATEIDLFCGVNCRSAPAYPPSKNDHFSDVLIDVNLVLSLVSSPTGKRFRVEQLHPEELLFQKWNFTPDLPQTMRCCADAGGSSAS